MSTHLEHALISRVLTDSDFHTLEKSQIDESYFTTSEAREVYRYLKDLYHHPQTAGEVPSVDMVKIRFPSFYPVAAPDKVSILCQQLRYERIQYELMSLSQNLGVRAQTDPIAAMAELRTKTAELSAIAEVGEDLSMSASTTQQWERYNTVASSGGVIGIPYPWAPLNEETQGMQPGQFIVIYGRPKTMKSWIGIYIAMHAYACSRRRVLFYTREMHPSMVLSRATACYAKVDYKAYKNATLQPELRDHVFECLQTMAQCEQNEVIYKGSGTRQPFFIITTDRTAGGGGGGVGWLQAKIRELQPDLVVVDGMYLMKDDRSNQRTIDWKAVAHISQDLKLTSQEFEIPVIGITQANRASEKSKGEDLTELAYADSLGQDADAVYRVNKKVILEEGQKKTYIYLTAPGLREGVFEGIILNAHPGVSFDLVKTLTGQEDAEEEYAQKQNKSPAGSLTPTFGGQRSGYTVDPHPKLFKR